MATTELAGYTLLRCVQCAHRFAPQGASAAAEYNALYRNGEYQRDQLVPLGNQRTWRTFAWLPPYRKFALVLGDGRGRSLLDVGCGAGRFCLVAQAAHWRVAGIDPAAEAVEIGQAAAGLALTSRTLDQVVAGGERYDVVTLFDVLEHLTDPVGLLAAARSALLPGGRLFATVPNFDCPLMRSTTRRNWLPPVHLQFFTQASLLAAAQAAQWRTLDHGTLDTDPPPPDALAWLRWLSRRIRRHQVWQAQLWLLAGE